MTISGTYRGGKVELDAPVDWVEGARVEVSASDKIGITEAEWPRTPEEIARALARMETFEPPELSTEDEKNWMEFRGAIKAYTLLKMNQRVASGE